MRNGESIGHVARVGILVLVSMAGLAGCVTAGTPTPPIPKGDQVPPICSENGMVTANVVALDQPIWNNRLGASMPSGMIFALERDVCEIDDQSGGCKASSSLTLPLSTAGNVMLKSYKRPRPITLRVNRQQCLRIHLKNLLSNHKNRSKNKGDPPNRLAPTGDGNDNTQPSTRRVGVHIQGMEWVKTLENGGETLCSGNDPQTNSPACNDGSWVGKNPTSLIGPEAEITYTVYAAHEGTFVLNSTGDNYTGGHGDGGTMPLGLFGAVHVQPMDAEYYRSQVTAKDLAAASSGDSSFHQPLIEDYAVDYTTTVNDPCFMNGTCRVGPILSMLCTRTAVNNKQCVPGELVHSDLTAIMTGGGAGRFDGTKQEPQILDSDDARSRLGDQIEAGTLGSSYALPDRLQPYREFTIMYHDAFLTSQAFQTLYNNSTLQGALMPGGDFFGFNYGMGGIGSEILANRFKLGPMRDCTACKYEEFFLTSWAVGDPAMVVDKTADSACRVVDEPPKDPPPETTVVPTGDGQYFICEPTLVAPATVAYYPDDPSNVYHSYLSDHTKFRIAHGAADLHHLHHQHAHQWMHSPDTSNGDYTDSQSIGPGSAFTLEMVYNGSGNVNQTVGDSIFHCHFYPHFAAGMWGLWRVHDVYETGTELADCDSAPNCPPKTGVRALPDGEIDAGTPIPAVVPMPTLPMPPMPSNVRLTTTFVNEDGVTTQGNGVQETIVEVEADNGDWVPAIQSPEGKKGLSKEIRNPGFPFFIPGVAGQRAPHPPLDFAYVCDADSGGNSGKSCVPNYGFEEDPGRESPLVAQIPDDSCQKICKGPGGDPNGGWQPLDGGLPRHVILGDGDVEFPIPNATDYSKILKEVSWLSFPDPGTVVERSAMRAHSHRMHPSVSPSGQTQVVNGYHPQGPPRPASFLYNGLPPVHGAPYADPCIKYRLKGNTIADPLHLEPLITRQYLAADIQIDGTYNKEGWHFPQQRMITLWGDVKTTMSGERPPEPFFFRSNSEECIDYTLANLVPNLYELDDFQVRTPTDILGQHIHLVKFDVTSSDGATNGFNYEDGTLAPNEVTERIAAINKRAGKDVLTAQYLPFFGPGPGGQWMGAQATIQRWWADPLLNRIYRSPEPIENPGVDRTLRTVFTHDHFGPSTHQQAGLYAGLVIEPHGSDWYCNDNALFCGTGDFFNKDPKKAKPFGGAEVGNVEKDGVPISTPARIAKHWDYGAAFNGAAPAVDVNDGGPTSWQSVIETHATCELLPGNVKKRCVADSNGSKVAIGFCRDDSDCLGYREFLFEFQDSTLMYEAFNQKVLEAHDTSLEAAIKKLYKTKGAGYCSNDTSRGCTPATATSPATGCQGAGVCYSYGFCSTDTSKPCRVKAWDIPEDIQYCDPPSGLVAFGPPVGTNVPSCNLVAGVPSDNLNTCVQPIGRCYVSQENCKLTEDCKFIAGWDAGQSISTTNQPELITLQNATFNFSMNYRNEPLFPRINTVGLDPLPGKAGDASFAYSSIERDTEKTSLLTGLAKYPNGLNGKPPYASPLTPGVGPNDPFTPLVRAHPGDDVQIRILVGAHINPHNFTFQGLSWLMEPSFVDSGWRNSQVMGISEHFEVLTQVPPFVGDNDQADYLYMPGAAGLEQASGSWGIMRAYGKPQDDLRPLPHNAKPKTATGSVCELVGAANKVRYEVVATTVKQAFGHIPEFADKGLIYTPEEKASAAQRSTGAWDPSALIYIDKKNLDCSTVSADCKATMAEPEPLVLRAPAGWCIEVELHNVLPAPDSTCPEEPKTSNEFNYHGSRSPTLFQKPDVLHTERLRANSCTSTNVGLHPQLVAFNTTESNGFNVGDNPEQTVPRGASRTYHWYAGHIDPENNTPIPVEFGVANLIASDALNHWQHGFYAGLVVEPADWDWQSWRDNAKEQGVSTTIQSESSGTFREHVVFTADGLGLADTQQFPSRTMLTLDEAVSLNALNYHAPIFDAGLGSDVYRTCLNAGGHTDQSCVLTTNGTAESVQPPTNPAIFEACAGETVRFHFLHPGGINTNNTMEIFGHVWSEAPYESLPHTALPGNGCVPPTLHTNLYSSGVLGDNNECAGFLPGQARDENLSLNEWQGSHMGHGPQNHMTFLLDSAGGADKAPGDYLIRSYPAMHFRLGMWGIFRVNDCSSGDGGHGASGQ